MATKTLKDGTTVITKTVYETGHAKNAANFSTFLNVIRSMADRYKPANPAIAVKALDAKEERMKSSIDTLTLRNREAENATNERNKLYEQLRPFATRLMATLSSSAGVNELILADAAGYNRKIQGQRAAKIASTDAASADAPPKRTISASRQSFDLKAEHFRNLRVLLESVPGYKPHEKDLEMTAVRAYEQSMLAANEKVRIAENELIDARNARNTELYDDANGVVALSKLMKAYLKGVLGSTHPDYKKVSALNFRQISGKASALK